MPNDTSSVNDRLSTYGSSLAGGIAGAFSRFTSAPLDVLKIRFQLQVATSKKPVVDVAADGSVARYVRDYTSVGQAVRKIVHDEGFFALWKGAFAGTLLWAFYMGISYPVQRDIKRIVEDYRVSLNSNRDRELRHAILSLKSNFYESKNPSLVDIVDSIETNALEPKEAVRRIFSTHFNDLSLSSKVYLSSAIAWSRFEIPSMFPSIIGGAFAAFFAVSATYPLDWARTRLASIRSEKAIASIPSISGTVVSGARRHLLVDMIVGTAMRKGITSIYQGIMPTLLSTVPAVAMNFALHDLFVELINSHGPRSFCSLHRNFGSSIEYLASKGYIDPSFMVISFLDEESMSDHSAFIQIRELVSGGMSGLLSKIIIYPLDTVKKRMQTQDMLFISEKGKKRYVSVIQALSRIIREEGVIRGLYKGTAPSILKTTLTTSLTFWAYERASNFFVSNPKQFPMCVRE